MFLAPARVLEVSPPRPRKKERRIASHRVSPPTPACSLSLVSSAASPSFSSSSFYVGGGTDAGTSIFQCPVRRMLLSLSCSFRNLRPWDFLGHGSVIWCSTDVFPPPLLLRPERIGRSLARSDPSISALSAPLGPAHAGNGYPSFLRAHHLSPTDREVEPSRRFPRGRVHRGVIKVDRRTS